MNELKDLWKSFTDNDFANSLYRILRDKDLISGIPTTANLCSRCSKLDVLESDFRTTLRPTVRSRYCQLCNLFNQKLKDFGYTENGHIEIHRKGSKIHVKSTSSPILSIYIHPDLNVSPTPDVQLGTPNLPDDGSTQQIQLFKEWIRVCDETHNHSSSSPVTRLVVSQDSKNVSSTSQLVDPPTRLVDVGGAAGDRLRLVLGEEMQSPIFFALSHCWGDKDEYQVGRTLPNNVIARFNAITLAELPRNFQEAIKITREMGVRYLWIDSICIIQTDGDDWKREAVRMEQVYSNATCVLAASSSNSSREGFLKDSRKKRQCVAVKSRSGQTIYICEDIDDFHTDVEGSVLNSRGWVLQERALARRIIHFTKNQAYFECGNGIHCESLMKMSNGKAALLGDSNFPRSAESFHKTGKIVIMQNLYKQYSSLAFKFFADRPVGISGLERRLTSAYDTRGGYGILEQYLERSLLWKRDEKKYLKRIQFPPERNLPSWSWMAYSGAIVYVEVGFNQVDWTNEYVSPFASLSGPANKQHWEATGNNRLPVLEVKRVRGLNARFNHDEILANVSFDVTSHSIKELRCVVLGKRKRTTGNHPLPCYVLIVKPVVGSNIFVRVGAGTVLESHICWDLHESGSLQ